MKSRIALLLVFVMLVLALVSCGGGKTPESTKPKYEKAAVPDWQNYLITYSSEASSTVSASFTALVDMIKEKYGVDMRIGDDFMIPGETAPTDTLEILIGKTNRAESQALAQTAKAGDYVIKFENNRLVIYGGSDEATAAAIEHYMTYLLGDEGLMYPVGGYEVKGNYVVDTLTIGGVDISEFVIVRGTGMTSSERLLSTMVQNAISDTCGVVIPFVLASEKEAQYEILIGNTGRAETSTEVKGGCVNIVQTENKLALYGNGDYSAAYAIKYFINDIL